MASSAVIEPKVIVPRQTSQTSISDAPSRLRRGCCGRLASRARLDMPRAVLVHATIERTMFGLDVRARGCALFDLVRLDHEPDSRLVQLNRREGPAARKRAEATRRDGYANEVPTSPPVCACL